MRVLWLIKGLGPGGAERLLVSMAPHVDRERFEVEAAYLLPWKDHLVGELAAAGVPATSLGVRRSWDARWVGRLRRLVADRGIDLVHAHLPYAAIGARSAFRRGRAAERPALVYTEHNTWDRYRPATRRLNAGTFSRNDAVIAVSAGVVASMGEPRAGWPPVSVIPNGGDVEGLRAEARDRGDARADLGVPEDALVVGTVGGITAKKGHTVLVRAAARVVKEHPEVRFVFVGLPIDPEPVRREIAAAGLEDRVRLAGYRPRAAALMPAFDLFCLPSRFEGMPVSLLEAMGLGVPCVATSVGGVPEVVTDGKDALLVPPDDPEALSEALLRALGDDALRAVLAEEGRATASRFGMVEMVRRTEEVYVEALARVRGGTP